jgi:beta-lactamase regulating signal transducer with metallopeptidase domain
MMRTVIEFAGLAGSGLPAPLADTALKGVLIVALAAVATHLLRNAPAAARHLAWTLAFAGLLLLPLLSVALPAWRVPLLPADLLRIEVGIDDPAPGAPAVEAAALPVAASSSPSSSLSSSPSSPSSPELSAVPAVRTETAEGAGDEQPGMPWAMMLAAAWAAGALAVLGTLALGMARLARTGRRVRAVTGGRIAEAAARLAARSGVRRPVTVLLGAEDAMPLTWGVFRPRILLPGGAERWTAERLEAVLLHELAHVRRLDCLWQVAAEAACAVHWFNPLVWAAARRLRLEGEHACDDHVLAAGPRASDYADHLLDVARTLRRPRAASLAAVAMARPGQLKTRLLAVLSERRRRGPVPRGAWGAAVALAALVVVPLAALSPTFQVTADTTAPLRQLGAGCRVEGVPYSDNDLDHGSYWTVEWSSGPCGGKARIDGQLRFSDDFTDVAAIEPGGGLVLTLWDAGTRRRVEIERGRDGTVTRRLEVDGRERRWDAQAQAWLAVALPELLRHTSYAREARNQAILAHGGAEALVKEVEMMSGSALKSGALRAVAASGNADRETLLRALRQAAALQSSGDATDVLLRLAPRLDGDRALRAAYIDAARTLGSGADTRRALAALLAEQPLADETWLALLDAGGRIGSDHEREVLLGQAAAAIPTNTVVVDGYLRVVHGMRSDAERRRALVALARRGLDRDAALLVAAEARELRSDPERRVLVEQAAPFVRGDAAVRAAYLELARGIRNDAQRALALAALSGGAPAAGREEAAAARDTVGTTELQWTRTTDGRQSRSTLRARNVNVAADRSRVEFRGAGGWALITEEAGGVRRTVRLEPGPDGRVRTVILQGDFTDLTGWIRERLAEFAGAPGKVVRW